MEHAIQVQFLAFLTEHDLLSDYQSGFRKKHTTETAIVYLTDYILEHMDRQMTTGAVFIDLKKAFDLLDHECLLFKLEHHGVRGSSVDWFRNYLTKQTQRVQFGNDKSSTQAIGFGVPQGSILGPLLFVLYINDLPQCLENCSILMFYADDTVMCSMNLCTSEIDRMVKDDLNRVAQWMESSRLIINQSKTKSVLFGSWQNLAKSPNSWIQFYGKTLERVAKFSCLGVVLDENLSWKDHVEYVNSKVSRRLGLLSCIRTCLTEASKQVYTSLLQPLFDYAGDAWGEISEGCCKELRCLQNRAAQIMLRKNTSNDTFCVLNWLNRASRRKMHKCILVFTCLNNLEPKYLMQYFNIQI